jgi:hypothetical protein
MLLIEGLVKLTALSVDEPWRGGVCSLVIQDSKVGVRYSRSKNLKKVPLLKRHTQKSPVDRAP